MGLESECRGAGGRGAGPGGTGTAVTQASEFEGANNQQNPFQRILHKLDKILDALKGGGGQEGNHTLRWDQHLPAAQRFIVLAAFNSEAVLDKNTGLVWERSPDSPPKNWYGTDLLCIDKIIGGQKGWRLPSIPELTSLIAPSGGAPPLPPDHPFLNVKPGVYWSATTVVGHIPFSTVDEDRSSAWGVDFSFRPGPVGGYGKTSNFSHSWCVRGGMNADQY